MYVRVIRFVLGPDREWEAEHAADVLATMTQHQVGCLGFHFYADHHNGEYQTTSFWDSEEHWDASFQVMWPIFNTIVGDDVQWRPVVQRFEAYEPRMLFTRS